MSRSPFCNSVPFCMILVLAIQLIAAPVFAKDELPGSASPSMACWLAMSRLAGTIYATPMTTQASDATAFSASSLSSDPFLIQAGMAEKLALLSRVGTSDESQTIIDYLEQFDQAQLSKNLKNEIGRVKLAIATKTGATASSLLKTTPLMRLSNFLQGKQHEAIRRMTADLHRAELELQVREQENLRLLKEAQQKVATNERAIEDADRRTDIWRINRRTDPSDSDYWPQYRKRPGFYETEVETGAQQVERIYALIASDHNSMFQAWSKYTRNTNIPREIRQQAARIALQHLEASKVAEEHEHLSGDLESALLVAEVRWTAYQDSASSEYSEKSRQSLYDFFYKKSGSLASKLGQAKLRFNESAPIDLLNLRGIRTSLRQPLIPPNRWLTAEGEFKYSERRKIPLSDMTRQHWKRFFESGVGQRAIRTQKEAGSYNSVKVPQDRAGTIFFTVESYGSRGALHESASGTFLVLPVSGGKVEIGLGKQYGQKVYDLEAIVTDIELRDAIIEFLRVRYPNRFTETFGSIRALP